MRADAGYQVLPVERGSISAFVRRLLTRRLVANADARAHQRAEFEQPRAQAISAGLDAIDHAVADHYVKYAVRGRRMQLRSLCEQLEVHRRGLLRQRVEERHHAVDDLDR